jgi:tetratricopeptide (TPR) repeat protein
MEGSKVARLTKCPNSKCRRKTLEAQEYFLTDDKRMPIFVEKGQCRTCGFVIDHKFHIQKGFRLLKKPKENKLTAWHFRAATKQLDAHDLTRISVKEKQLYSFMESWLALHYAEQGDEESARRHLNRTQSVNSLEEKAKENIIVSLVLLRDERNAQIKINDFFGVNHNNALIHYITALVERGKNWQKGKNSIKAAIQLCPNEKRYYCILGMIQYYQGEIQDSVETFREGVEPVEQIANVANSIIDKVFEQYPIIHRKRGLAYAGNVLQTAIFWLEDAYDELDRHEEKVDLLLCLYSPSDPEERDYLIITARGLMEKGEYQLARKIAEKIQELDDLTDAAPHFLRGEIYLRQANTDKNLTDRDKSKLLDMAVSEFKQAALKGELLDMGFLPELAFEEKDVSFRSHSLLGDTYFEKGLYEIALNEYLNAAQLKPGNKELQRKVKRVQAVVFERTMQDVKKWFDDMDQLASVGMKDLEGKWHWLYDQLRKMSALDDAEPYDVYKAAKTLGLGAAIDLFRKNFNDVLIKRMKSLKGELKLPDELAAKANFVRIFCNIANHEFGRTYKWSDLMVLVKFCLDLLKWYEESKHR